MAPSTKPSGLLEIYSQLSFTSNLRKANFRKKKMRQRLVLQMMQRLRTMSMSGFFQIVLMAYYQSTIRRPITRRFRRLARVQGWWNIVWNTFDNKRFKQNFRITKATFLYILNEVELALSKRTVAEEPVPSEVRLAVCLYRLARGDYLHTVAELLG